VWPDRPQEPRLGEQLQVVADRGGRYLVALHERDIPGGKRLIAHGEGPEGADSQRMGEHPERPRQLGVGMRAVVPAVLKPHGR
jgi:hypothetical protein